MSRFARLEIQTVQSCNTSCTPSHSNSCSDVFRLALRRNMKSQTDSPWRRRLTNACEFCVPEGSTVSRMDLILQKICDITIISNMSQETSCVSRRWAYCLRGRTGYCPNAVSDFKIGQVFGNPTVFCHTDVTQG